MNIQLTYFDKKGNYYSESIPDFSRDVEKAGKVRDYRWRTKIIFCTWKFPQVNLVIPA